MSRPVASERRPRSFGGIGVIVVLIGAATLAGVAGPAPAAADGTLTKLAGEGGSFAQPIIDKLQTDGSATIAPIVPTYFNANIDQGRQDFVNGSTDYAVSELPLTGAEIGTAQANGRSFAYIPFAASPLAIGAVVECSNDTVLKPTTMCPKLELSIPLLAKVFSLDFSQWSAAGLAGISAGNPDSVVPTSNSNNLIPKYVVDPTASNEELMATFVASPQGKLAWDAYLNHLGITDDTPSEIWPTHGGISGGDEQLADKLVPLDPANGQPQSNPQVWGQGFVAPLPAAWIGAPRHVPTIAIQNAAGAYVEPTVAGATAALADATLDPATHLVTFTSSVTDTAAYPLTMMSYLVVPTKGLSADKAKALAKFIAFVLGTTGQADVAALGAAPVTPAMVSAGLAVAATVANEGVTTTTTTTSSTTTSTVATSTTTSTLAPVVDPGGSVGSGGLASSGGAAPTLAYTGFNTAPLFVVGAVLALVGALWRRRLRPVMMSPAPIPLQGDPPSRHDQELRP